MTLTRQRMTLAEYMAYDDGPDARHVLVNGELTELPSESDLNNAIAITLLLALAKHVPGGLLRRGTEIVVSGLRATTRIPDLLLLSGELASELAGASRSLVTLDMSPPKLAIEVVSPGAENIERDYRYKRSEYAARGIAEYWIVDPIQAQVVVLTLVSGLYDEQVFQGQQPVISKVAPEFNLTVAAILNPLDT